MISEVMASKLTGKVVFLDFDGVLATYQSRRDKVHTDFEEYLHSSIVSSYEEIYKYTRAPETIKQIVARLKPDDTYMLTQVDVIHEFRNKIRFMHEFYPNVPDDNMLFVAKSAYKVKVMNGIYMKKYFGKVPKSDIILIDDTINVISEVEDAGFTCYHISSFVD